MNEFICVINDCIIEKDDNTGGYIAIKNGKPFISHSSLDRLLDILSKLEINKK